MSVEQYKVNLANATTVAQVANCLHGDLPYVPADYATKELLVALTMERMEALEGKAAKGPVADLKAQLIAECVRLKEAMAYHDRIGVHYWPDVARELYEPEGPAECGICTNGARLIARKFNGMVAGYHIRSDEPRQLVAAVCYGHDFAVVENFIVDWWAWAFAEEIQDPVFTIEEGINSGRYKAQEFWSVNPHTEFRREVAA